jgi:hypothetical protein
VVKGFQPFYYKEYCTTEGVVLFLLIFLGGKRGRGELYFPVGSGAMAPRAEDGDSRRIE